MTSRRTLLLALTLATSFATLSAARADHEPFPGSKPPLKEGSIWVETDWGYKLKTLSFPTSGKFATLYQTEGYGGAGRPNMYLRMPDGELMAMEFRASGTFDSNAPAEYVRVRASVRGTECSGGSYNLYDRVHAWDGHHIVEWISSQTWSNGAVGLHGSSLSGQTAYWIATTKPKGLKAVSANLLHSDIYRDIFMVGGVQNYLFPTIWTYGTGPHRIPRDRINDRWFFDDEICQFNQTTKYSALDPVQPQNEPAWAAIRSVDDDWYTAHAALTYADNIKIPYYQQSNWQDEQVGPRGLILWKHISPDPVAIACSDQAGVTKTFAEPKKMTVSSGDHGWGQFHNRDLWKFYDLFLLNKCGAAGVMEHRVESFFETRGDPRTSDFTARAYGDDWPLAGTRWPKTYLHRDHGMSTSLPGAEPGDTYLSGVATKNWFWETPDNLADEEGELWQKQSYPDQAYYLSDPIGSQSMPVGPDGNFVVNGPILMNLWATMAGTDTDFFVSVSDVYPDDHPTHPNWVSYLQRGWLKASHRAVDPVRSYYAPDPDNGNAEILVQPYMTHTNPQPVVPGDPVEYKLEIFPLGHIFRPGHRILIQIHTPPAVDGLWGYTPTHHQPAAVTILHDAAHPTWIQWPQITLPADQPAPYDVGTPPVHVPGALGVAPAGCKVPGGFPCLPASRLDLEL